MESIVVGICGASGVILGFRTVEALCRAGFHVDLIITDAARQTATIEVPFPCDTDAQVIESFPSELREMICCQPSSHIGATVASGTYPTRGMIIVPCSMTTLAAISIGLGDTLVRRAAHVTIKEGRPLLLVPREMPLSPIHLEHMLKLSKLGVILMPPQPAWYQKPATIEDVERYIVARILHRLGVPSDLHPWAGSTPYP